MPVVATTEDAEVSQALHGAVAEALRPVARALAALYAALAVSHALLLEPTVAAVMGPVAAASAACYAVLSWRFGRHTPPPAAAPVLAFGLAVLVLINALTHLVLVGDPTLTSNLGLLLIAAACLYYSHVWLAALVVLVLVSWAAVALAAPPATGWLHQGFSLTMSGLAAWLVHAVRYRAQARLERQKLALVATNQQLAAAEAAARELAAQAAAANQAKSQFLANMSHETRTPLHTVTSMTELLLASDLTPAQFDCVSHIRAATATLLGGLDDLLDCSELEAGTATTTPTIGHVREVVESAIDQVAAREEARGLELAGHVAAAVPPCGRADWQRIHQVLVRLLANAVKFTPAGHVALDVTATPLGGQRQELRFAVSDTGVGVPDEARERVFELFEQADSSSARQFGGAGLGLAIARRVAALLGGQLGCESHPQSGSTFWLSVPIEVVEQGAPEPPPQFAGHAVIFEADPVAAADLAAQLAACGLTAETVNDSATGLARLRTGPPCDWAFIEVVLPDGDGVEVAATLAGARALAGVRRVLMGHSWQRGPAVRAAEQAGAAWLSKPVRQAQLRACLQGLAEPPSGRESAAAGPRVLVVEDNPVNQTVVGELLRLLGYRVEVASNGAEAIDATTETQFDAILMDCQMPGIDGYEATREIRRLETRRTPIIALTAHALAGDRERCLAAGMDDYLTKPVTGADLDQALRRWLPHQAAGPVPDPEPAVADPPAVLDPVLVGELQGLEANHPGFLAGLVQTFTQQWTKGRAELKQAADTADAEETRRLAHRLKGASASVAALPLSAQCLAVEQAASNADWAALPGCLAALDAAAEEALAAWRSLVPG